jgi:trimeric autotransporter adhesin
MFVCLFVSQLSFHCLAQGGIITTYAGPAAIPAMPLNGALATTQAIDLPTAVTPDGNGGFYFVSSLWVSSLINSAVYRVCADGKIRLVAGSDTSGYSGDGGPATLAQLYLPYGIVADAAGNLYISDTYNNRIRKVSSSGFITTIAGTGPSGSNGGYSGDGGPATSAQLNLPHGLVLDAAGNLFIADSGNNRIRKVTPGGVISTVAGNGNGSYGGDGGPATAALLNFPEGIAVDAAGNLFIADVSNCCIRKVSTSGIIVPFWQACFENKMARNLL